MADLYAAVLPYPLSSVTRPVLARSFPMSKPLSPTVLSITG